MSLNRDVRLQDLVPFIGNFLVKLKIDFLRRLITKASKSTKPWCNKKFVESIGYTFNEEWGFSPGMEKTFRKGTALPISTLQKIIELSKFKWDEVENNVISLRAGRNRGEVSIKFPIRINRSLGLITGHIIGDGSIDKRYSQVFYTNQNKELAHEFYLNMQEIFGVDGRIWSQRADFYNGSKWIKRVNAIDDIPDKMQIGLFYPSIVGKILHVILGKFAAGKRKYITKQILDSVEEFKIGLIASFFDDEGSVQADHHLVRFYQNSKKILDQIRLMLKEIKIGSNPIRHYYKTGKKRHYFSITGYKNYYLFYKLVGCTSSNKRREFETLIGKVRNSKRFKSKFAI